MLIKNIAATTKTVNQSGLTLSENSVRFPDGDVVLSPQQQTRKVCEPINGFSCQKLGVLCGQKQVNIRGGRQRHVY